MARKKIIGIDLGGTNVRVGLVDSRKILRLETQQINSKNTPDEIIRQIFAMIDSLGTTDFAGIGLGVPGPVDDEKGIVYELINIPAWKKEFVREKFQEQYDVPLKLQNDANCFALAEKFYGKGRDAASFIGLIVGTGIAGGIIINNKLYTGPNSMAGEFGMMKYLDHHFEYYCSGQFFDHQYKISAREAAELAERGNHNALNMWREFGHHLGYAVESILYAYDPEVIIFGGSVSKSMFLYEKWIWDILKNFQFPNSLEKFELKVSELEHPGVLGAAALHFHS